MTNEDLIEFLKEPNCYWVTKTNDTIDSGFIIKPDDFFSYAEKDLENNYDHNLINSLSNAKRALDCQVDSLLVAFGYYSYTKKKTMSFPKKIEIIKDVGILAPRILLKINKARNLMEHHYMKPTREQVEDFVDVVALFIASTDKFLYNFNNFLEIRNDFKENIHLRVDINYKEENISINVSKDHEKYNFLVKSEDLKYTEILKYILSISYKNPNN